MATIGNRFELARSERFLGLFGYAPGSRDAVALDALMWAYCLLPCGLKLAAAALLVVLWLRSPEGANE